MTVAEGVVSVLAVTWDRCGTYLSPGTVPKPAPVPEAPACVPLPLPNDSGSVVLAGALTQAAG